MAQAKPRKLLQTGLPELNKQAALNYDAARTWLPQMKTKMEMEKGKGIGEGNRYRYGHGVCAAR